MAREEWLPKFEKTHREWIHKVTLTYLKKTGGSLDSFLKYWLIPAFPINEIGIMLLARFFHGHIAIFVNEKWWSTQKDGNLSMVNLFLVYRGQKVFDNSRLMTTAEYDLVRDDVRRYKLKIEQQIKAEQKKKEEAKKKAKNDAKPTTSMTTHSRARKLPSSSSSSESNSESLDLEKIMDDDLLHNTPAKTSEDIMQKPNTNLTQDDAGVNSSDKARQSDLDDSVDKNVEAAEESDIMQKDAPNDKATRSDSASEDNIMQKDYTNDKGLKSDWDSDDNIALADLRVKAQKKTGNKPK